MAAAVVVASVTVGAAVVAAVEMFLCPHDHFVGVLGAVVVVDLVVEVGLHSKHSYASYRPPFLVDLEYRPALDFVVQA